MNDPDFKHELADNSERVAALIEDDPFPSRIEPLFLRETVRDYPLRGGKRLRSALLSWACGALGGDPENAIHAAAAVEIYHNWTLVHDDIIDNDSLRRNAPSAHASLAEFAGKNRELSSDSAERFGRDFAILAGDIQQGWAVNMLLKSLEAGGSNEAVIFLAETLQCLTASLISGEALDVDFAYRLDDPPSQERVRRMLELKTGALLEFCAIAGAVIAIDSTSEGRTRREKNYAGVREDPRLRALADFALYAGTAFQLRDDWLGVFGDETRLGKPVCSDVAEGKPTTLFLEAISSLSASDAERLKSFVGRSDFSEKDICEIRALIDSSSAAAKIQEEAEMLLDRSKQSISSIPESAYKRLLLAWADFLVERNY